MEKPQLVNFIAKVLEDSGFKVYKNFKTSQQVVDIYAILQTSMGDFGLVVACKNYDKDWEVGIDVLKEMEVIGKKLRASKVAVVTSSGPSPRPPLLPGAVSRRRPGPPSRSRGVSGAGCGRCRDSLPPWGDVWPVTRMDRVSFICPVGGSVGSSPWPAVNVGVQVISVRSCFRCSWDPRSRVAGPV